MNQFCDIHEHLTVYVDDGVIAMKAPLADPLAFVETVAQHRCGVNPSHESFPKSVLELGDCLDLEGSLTRKGCGVPDCGSLQIPSDSILVVLNTSHSDVFKLASDFHEDHFLPAAIQQCLPCFWMGLIVCLF